jgi:WD40 repeat protein/predicted ATPase/DNA-binding SARP family transcriptional activator/uncharacterized protein YjbI with pentapeptide repeats
MPTRALTLLGAIKLTIGGVPVTRFHSDKVRALLAYLAAEPGRPHARAALAALLWPEQGDAAALRNLSQTLVRLRQVLGHSDSDPAPLHVTWQTIQWQADAADAAEVDVIAFTRLARQGDPDSLGRAVALYSGEFLAGFSLPGCEAFEEWLLLMREQLHQQALAALHTLAEYFLSTRRWPEAAGSARRQIELDRWREDAHRQLMRAQIGLGDRAAALAAYQRCEQILRDELDIAPDGATMALAAQIRSGVIPESRAPAPMAAEVVAARPVLPAPLSELFGREDELARIGALLTHDGARLVTIVGAGGAGKTRLALAGAWALAEAFAGGVGWVSLAGIAPNAGPHFQPDALAAAAGAALGLPFEGRRAPIEELCLLLGERDVLLVLDNCEHLPAASFVRALLVAAPRLRVLATSRSQLGLPGEALVRLEGLPVPERGDADPARYAGVRLFLERAQSQAPGLGREADDLAAVARLCRMLGGLPLAIELAARWVGHYTCDEIATQLQADLDFLVAHGPDTSERHHSMRAVFDYSWSMLREPERQALARLSVFGATFDRAAAGAVAATSVSALAALVDASLLRHLGVGRYGIHELVRQFAAARCAERGEVEALAERHSAYYLDLVAQQEARLYGDAPQLAAAVIRDAADNIRQAWSWAVAHGAWDAIARSLPALRQFTWIDGLFYEQAAHVAEAAEQISARGAEAAGRMVLLGRLRATQASFLERQEARAAAAEAARAAIACATAAGDAVGEAYGYLQLSNAAVPYIALLAPDDAQAAIGWLEQAIALCRSARDVLPRERRFALEVEAACLLKLSTIRIDLREFDEACALGEQALALTQLGGDRMHEARALSYSAMALENAGRFQAAYERRRAMLELARANGSRLQEHLALNNLSCTLLYLGDYPAALEHAQAALRISGEWMQNPYHAAEFHHTLSWAACHAGQAELALESARQALAFAQASGAPRNQTLPLLALGDALHDLRRYDEALVAYAAALALARERQTPQPVAAALAGMARCQLARGAWAEALQAVDEVLQGPDPLSLGSLWEPLRIAETCYRVLRASGDPRAAELLQSAAALLEQQAGDLADPARRRVFLEDVPAHRAILAARDGGSPDAGRAAAGHWDDAPQSSHVFGRAAELDELERRLVHERCQLVALVGLGGVGKSTLAAAAAQAVTAHFDIVIWRSLLNAPALEELLRDILPRLTDQHLVELPASLDALLTLLVDDLRRQRCLLVLDNLESILDADHPGHMRPGYDGYAQLLQRIAELRHRSCLLLTSREQPQDVARLGSENPLVHTLWLGGLDVAAGRALLSARGLQAGDREAGDLIERYSGNPLALNLVSRTVQELFGSSIADFLVAAAPIFGDIRAVLDQQLARLSSLEQGILIWLAIEREPVSIQELRDNLIDPGSPRAFLEALHSLRRRALVEQHARGCTLQNVVTEYLTDVLVNAVFLEIAGPHAPGATPEHASSDLGISSSTLSRYALLKATAKEHVRASQARQIVGPLAQQLEATLGSARLFERLRQLIAGLRRHSDGVPGYAAGNILNLLLHLGADMRGYDFSGLTIRQAYLRGAELPDVNFYGADLLQTVFTHIFGEILAIHFDGEQLLIAGVSEARLCLWRAAGGRLLREQQSFGSSATIASFSPDGRLIVTGDTDHQVRLWDAARGLLLHSLSGHSETPWGLVLSADRATLASSGADGTVCVWDVATGRLQQTLRGHSAAVPALAFSGDGQLLASGDTCGTICIWRLGTAEPLHTLRGHSDEVHALVFDASGTILASGSHDRTIGLWDANCGQLLHSLSAHTEVIRTLAMSPDGHTLASGGGDTFVCLWDVHSGQPLHTLLELVHRTNFLSFSADGGTLATVGGDHSIDLWDVATGRRHDSLRAYRNVILAIDFSPDGRLLASSGTDAIARLWELGTAGRAARTFRGHTSSVYAVAYSPDGALLASAGCDKAIRLWDTSSGRSIRALYGHGDDVEAIQFSPDGRWLLSASRDTTLRVWDVGSGQTVHILRGHSERVLSCAFSPDGRRVASGGIDRTVRLWDVRASEGARALHTLIGHSNAIRCVAFNSDGRILATSGFDQIVRLWDAHTGQLLCDLPAQDTITTSIAFHPDGRLLATGAKDHCVRLWDIAASGAPAVRLRATLRGHTNSVEAVRFSPDRRLVASGGADGTISLWDLATGACVGTMQADGPYAGMNITRVTGINTAQRASLTALGAVELA